MSVPMNVSGDVVAVHSYWTDDGSRVITESTIRTDDGQEIVVSQLGGSADGFGQIQWPAPPILHQGMIVALAAHEAFDLAQQPHVLVDDVRVLADPAGFVRTGPTKAGNYLYWESGCIFVSIADEGTKEIPGDQEFPVIDASIATWNDDVAACSYMKVKSDGRVKNQEVGRDNVNVIKFRDDSWCRPAVGKDPARCYSDSSAGITTATYIDDATSSRDGAIVDADIEINGVNFDISVNHVSLGDSASHCQSELQNTLTHELGHLHGLEHPCLAPDDPPRVDFDGNPVPFCSDTSDPKIVDATMYNYQTCGETSKEVLSQDDIDGVCKVYPTAMDPNSCERVSSSSGGGGGGCDAGGGGAGLLVAFGALALGARRRKI